MNNPLLELKYLDADAKLLNPYNREVEPSKDDRAYITGFVSEKGIDQATRSVSGLVSTRNIDRYEEIIEPRAFAEWLPTFMQNPQFLAGHRMVGFDAAEPTNIGQWTQLQVEDAVGLAGTARFMDPGDPLSDKYWNRYVQGVLRAFSVGVIVHQWEMREYELGDGVTKRIRVLTEVELIEISAVSVPANRQALVRAASFAARQPEQAADTFDLQKLAKLVAQEQRGLIRDEIKSALPQLLNAEPGGPLYQVLLDIAEAWNLPPGTGTPSPDHGGNGDVPPAPTKGHPALDYMFNGR
jgi:HK97 family phage prohead protease